MTISEYGLVVYTQRGVKLWNVLRNEVCNYIKYRLDNFCIYTIRTVVRQRLFCKMIGIMHF